MKREDVYGNRSQRHHAIFTMSEEGLHDEYPWVESLTFNITMTKKEFNEAKVPDASCLFGTKQDGSTHRFVVGNEQGEILPKLLFAKFQMIESGKTYGKKLTIAVGNKERDRCKCFSFLVLVLVRFSIRSRWL